MSHSSDSEDEYLTADEDGFDNRKVPEIDLSNLGSSRPIESLYPRPSTSNTNLNDSLPPAPPPTPAGDTKNDKPSSQYGWRVPANLNTCPYVSKEKDEENSLSELSKSVLDKLSHRAGGSDKNLFEQIVTDLKKVSIKSRDEYSSPQTDHSQSSSDGSIPILSDLGLNSWSWSNASKLLASASTVTASVSSVLGSVNSALTQQPAEEPSAGPSNQTQASKTDTGISNPGNDKTSKMSPSEAAASNDDFLNMTFGVVGKAFDVMTERDKSGNLRVSKPFERLTSMISSQINQPVSTAESDVAKKKDYSYEHDKLD